MEKGCGNPRDDKLSTSPGYGGRRWIMEMERMEQSGNRVRRDMGWGYGCLEALGERPPKHIVGLPAKQDDLVFAVGLVEVRQLPNVDREVGVVDRPVGNSRFVGGCIHQGHKKGVVVVCVVVPRVSH